MPYQTLDARKIIDTARVLEQRITERFPGAGLGQVAGDLVELARSAQRETAEFERPHLPLRVASGSLILLLQ